MKGQPRTELRTGGVVVLERLRKLPDDVFHCVADFVPEHDVHAGVVLGVAQDAGVDGGPSARHDPGIGGFLVLDQVELPIVVINRVRLSG